MSVKKFFSYLKKKQGYFFNFLAVLIVVYGLLVYVLGW